MHVPIQTCKGISAEPLEVKGYDMPQLPVEKNAFSSVAFHYISVPFLIMRVCCD